MTFPTFIPANPLPTSHQKSHPVLHRHYHRYAPFELPSRRPRPTWCAASPPTPTPPNSTPSTPSASPRIGLVTVLLLLSSLIWTILISSLMFITSPFRRNTSWHASLTLLWMRSIFQSAFVRVKLHGRENLPTSAKLVVANSQSMLDMFALAFLNLDLRFVVPKRAMKVPVLGWMLAKAGWIGAGTDRKGQMKAMEECVDVLKGGSSVVMFPEGGMSANGVMKRFGGIMFKMAKKAGVDVLPVTLNGTGSMVSGGAVPWRFPKGGIDVTVHPEIDFGERSEREVASLAYEAVRQGLPKEIRGE